jgi:azobenzene reductase
MKVSILSGSIRAGRQSHKLAGYLETLLMSKGVATNIIDLSIYPLPVMGSAENDHTENISRVGSLLNESDALIFVSPEYHGSFPGVLKNALDHFWKEYNKKPIGVATASSGKMGGINASSQLQQVILSLGAYALPLKLLVPEIQLAFAESLEPTSPSLVSSANKFVDEFLWFADAIYQKKQQKMGGN